MALTLNTSHALYPNLVELIGIDTTTGLLASAKTARTFTAQTGATYPSTAGTYGKSAKTNPPSGIGAFSFTPGVSLEVSGCTLLVVVNNLSLTGGTAPYNIISTTAERSVMPAVNAAGKAVLGNHYSYATGVTAVGSSTVTGGAHVIAVTNDTSGGKVYVDGVLENTSAIAVDAQVASYTGIGGIPGFHAVGVELVWAAWFNRALTASEIASLTSSVGANNVIGLLEGAPAGGTPTVSSVTVNPTNPNVTGGTSQQFTATVTGTNNPGQGVTWSLSPTVTGASINSSGVFTAPAATASIQTFTITATSSVDGSKSGTATASVPATGAPPVTYTGVSVTPSTATVNGLATRQFSATVSGTGAFNSAVTWSVTGGSVNGTINSSGLYTAPASTTSPRTVTVVATAADNTTTGSAVVTVPATAGAGSFTTEQLINNAGLVLANISVRWSWFPNGRIGALAGITPVEGVGTTTAGGLLTATGLVAGPGVLMAAQWVNGPTDDAPYYQAGTVS